MHSDTYFESDFNEFYDLIPVNLNFIIILVKRIIRLYTNTRVWFNTLK